MPSGSKKIALTSVSGADTRNFEQYELMAEEDSTGLFIDERFNEESFSPEILTELHIIQGSVTRLAVNEVWQVEVTSHLEQPSRILGISTVSDLGKRSHTFRDEKLDVELEEKLMGAKKLEQGNEANYINIHDPNFLVIDLDFFHQKIEDLIGKRMRGFHAEDIEAFKKAIFALGAAIYEGNTQEEIEHFSENLAGIAKYFPEMYKKPNETSSSLIDLIKGWLKHLALCVKRREEEAIEAEKERKKAEADEILRAELAPKLAVELPILYSRYTEMYGPLKGNRNSNEAGQKILSGEINTQSKPDEVLANRFYRNLDDSLSRFLDREEIIKALNNPEIKALIDYAIYSEQLVKKLIGGEDWKPEMRSVLRMKKLISDSLHDESELTKAVNTELVRIETLRNEVVASINAIKTRRRLTNEIISESTASLDRLEDSNLDGSVNHGGMLWAAE